MATNLGIIEDALRELNVISEIDSASAEQGAHSLRALNRMLEAWTENGIDLGYFKQSSTADTIPIPEWAEDGVIAKLAVRIAPLYGATVSPELAVAATDSYRMIMRKSIVDKGQVSDMRYQPAGEGKYRTGGRILTET